MLRVLHTQPLGEYFIVVATCNQLHKKKKYIEIDQSVSVITSCQIIFTVTEPLREEKGLLCDRSSHIISSYQNSFKTLCIGFLYHLYSGRITDCKKGANKEVKHLLLVLWSSFSVNGFLFSLALGVHCRMQMSMQTTKCTENTSTAGNPVHIIVMYSRIWMCTR